MVAAVDVVVVAVTAFFYDNDGDEERRKGELTDTNCSSFMMHFSPPLPPPYTPMIRVKRRPIGSKIGGERKGGLEVGGAGGRGGERERGG